MYIPVYTIIYRAYKSHHQIDKSCVGRIPDSVSIAEKAAEGDLAIGGWSCPLPTALQPNCASFPITESEKKNISASLITINLSQLLKHNFHYKIWIFLSNLAGDVLADNYISVSEFAAFTC